MWWQHEAFEDAGIPASKYHGSETGVYVGLMNHDYAVMQDGTSMNNFSSPGSACVSAPLVRAAAVPVVCLLLLLCTWN